MSGTDTMPVRILSWTPVGKGPIIGRANILLGRALEIHGLLVMATNGKVWVAFPAIPKHDYHTDKLVRDARGKLDYSGGLVLKWSDRAIGDKFKNSVLAAITQQYGPEALGNALIEGGGQ